MTTPTARGRSNPWRRKQRGRRRLTADKVRDGARARAGHVGLAMGRDAARGLEVTATAAIGGVMGNPAALFAYAFRRALKPKRIAETVVRDAQGTIIARIVTDPVTGRRRRIPEPA